MEGAAHPERFTVQEYFTPGEQRRLRRFPQLIRTALGIVWRSSPRELVVCAVMQVVIGLGLGAQLLAIRELLTDLLAGGGADSFSSVLPELLVLTLVGAIVACAGAVLDAQQRVLGQLVALHASDEVIRTATGVDLVTYDEPGFHDGLQRAQLSAGSRPAQLVNGLLGVVGASFAIIAVAAALLVIEPLFCLLVLVGFIPAWLATSRAGQLIYRYSVEQTERERMRLYLFDLLTSKPQAQEVRAFGLGGFLGGRHRDLYNGLIHDLRDVLRRRLRVAIAGQLATSTLTGAALAVVVLFVTSERMSLAEAGSAAAAMILLGGRLRGLAASGGGLYESALYLEDYVAFVAAAPRIEARRPTRAAPEPEVLEADSVTFTYPSRTQPSLSDASLVLRRGEVVALVGENGSGKTTFAKLLAGLYQPEAGTIKWDGQDTQAFDPATVHDHVALIFQDFVRYQLSAHDNIAMGDQHRFDDLAGVEKAARAAGVHEAIEGLSQGYDTLLGPEYYGGSDFSGGQWQRIALARAFFRDAPIVILDEPTASLDARAEASLYSSMGELFSGRSVLLISHRFGSVRSADRIYVLREGSIVEQGSHQELMDADGYYAELFGLQASRYVD